MKSIFYLSIVLILFSCNGSIPDQETTINENDSVSEKSLIELGGEKQYVEINGYSKSKKILLFLHGGPGWPQTPQLRYFNSELTKHMVVVAWEQSGCGKSYLNNPSPSKLSLEQVVNDAHELTQLLKQKFNVNKIYLAGFSWGSIPGLMLAEKYPQDYFAYIGISQVLSLRKSIKASREWIKTQANLKSDKETLKQLNKLEIGDTSFCKRELDCFMQQYQLLYKYRGALFSAKAEEEIAKAEKHYQDYQNYDWNKAFLYSANRLEDDLFGTDLSNVDKIETPTYFIVGKHDWNIPASITEKFFNKLSCRKKEMFWFENSGHEPLSEEADKFNHTLIGIIKNFEE